MTKDILKLHNREVLERAREPLMAHLPLSAEGNRCTTEELVDVLLGIASGRGTLEQVCTNLPELSDPTTVRGYLNAQLEAGNLADVEAAVNAAVQTQIPQRVLRQRRKIAMDFHDRPYYGKSTAEDGMWVRGKAKAGTTRFYRLATAYVIHRDLRVTLAVKFVLPGMTTCEVLEALLQAVAALGITPRCLLLDRGFAGVAVMQKLDAAQIPAVIACPIRGKTGGTRALCQGRKSYRATHTFTSTTGAKYTAALAVCRVFTTHQRTGRAKRRARRQLYILIHLDLKPLQTKDWYRRRFGIETSYRCAGKARGWTTSPNPAYRFLLLGVAFFLLNVWVALQWLYTQVPRRGGRYLDTGRFRLHRMTSFLQRALEDIYGYVHFIVAPAFPRL